MILICGAILGFIAVAFGAYAEHGLRELVTEEHFRYLMTAIRYNQVHALVVVAIGLGLFSGTGLSLHRPLQLSGALFVVGTALFSFSIYLSVALGIPALVYITPVGGVTLMAAWLMLAWAGIRQVRRT